MDYKELIELAKAVRQNAYAPYSNFKVGAALLCRSGKVCTGCNVENLSFGATICAERCAVSKAISEGEREFCAIAIYAGEKFTSPCGICLQTLCEFAPGIDVILPDGKSEYRVYKLNELLPINSIPIK